MIGRSQGFFEPYLPVVDAPATPQKYINNLK